MTSEPHATPASDPDDWGVGHCACGRVVLNLGDVQRSFTADQFAELHRLLQAAMQQLGIPPNPSGLTVPHGVRH